MNFINTDDKTAKFPMVIEIKWMEAWPNRFGGQLVAVSAKPSAPADLFLIGFKIGSRLHKDLAKLFSETLELWPNRPFKLTAEKNAHGGQSWHAEKL